MSFEMQRFRVSSPPPPILSEDESGSGAQRAAGLGCFLTGSGAFQLLLRAEDMERVRVEHVLGAAPQSNRPFRGLRHDEKQERRI